MRRGRKEIIQKILQLARNGEKKTHIMYGVNSSFYQINRYLWALKAAKMLEINDSGEWKTTRLGIEMLSYLKRGSMLFNTFLDAFSAWKKEYGDKKELAEIIKLGR